jgi:hypothetical protein
MEEEEERRRRLGQQEAEKFFFFFLKTAEKFLRKKVNANPISRLFGDREIF